MKLCICLTAIAVTIKKQSIVRSIYGSMGVVLMMLISTGTVIGQDTLWTKLIQEPGDQYVRRVIQTSDGGFVFVSNTQGGGAPHMLFKTDSLGNLQWKQTYDFISWIGDIKEAVNGGYYVGGRSQYGVYRHFNLMRIDSQGDTVWTRECGGSEHNANRLYEIELTKDGNILLVGEVGHSSNLRSTYVVKTDTSGNVLWYKWYSGLSGIHEVSYSAVEGDRGIYWLTGVRGSQTSPKWNVHVTRIDSSGTYLWTHTYGNDVGKHSTDLAYSIKRAIDGGYIVSGTGELPNDFKS